MVSFTVIPLRMKPWLVDLRLNHLGTPSSLRGGRGIAIRFTLSGRQSPANHGAPQHHSSDGRTGLQTDARPLVGECPVVRIV